MDAHKNIIFISGHTHISMENDGCVEYDMERGNIYINDGSIRPTTVLKEDEKEGFKNRDGNLVELELSEDQITVSGVSLRTREEFLKLSLDRRQC